MKQFLLSQHVYTQLRNLDFLCLTHQKLSPTKVDTGLNMSHIKLQFVGLRLACNS